MNKKLQNRIERSYKYAAAPGAVFNDEEANEVVGPSLEAIRKSGQELTPDAVVEFAAADESPLHKFFEWNNDKAAVLYRKQQARQIVNHLLVVVPTKDGPKTTKAEFNFAVREDHDAEQNRQYFSFNTIENDPLLRARMYEECLREIRGFLSKWENVGLNEIEPLLQALRNVAK